MSEQNTNGPSTTDNIVKLNDCNDLSQPRSLTPPTCSIVKPATSLDVAALQFDLTQLENNVAAAPLAVPVDKPGEFEWVRVHPDPAFCPTFLCIDFTPPGTTSRELHIVHPNMAHILQATSAAPYRLFVLMNRVGGLRVCPVKLVGPDGKQNEWHRTRQLALEKGRTQWIRMWSNKTVGRYEWLPAPIQYPDPVWPPLTVGEILQIAFGDLGRVIDSVEHPVIKTIRGEL